MSTLKVNNSINALNFPFLIWLISVSLKMLLRHLKSVSSWIIKENLLSFNTNTYIHTHTTTVTKVSLKVDNNNIDNHWLSMRTRLFVLCKRVNDCVWNSRFDSIFVVVYNFLYLTTTTLISLPVCYIFVHIFGIIFINASYFPGYFMLLSWPL